MSDMFSEHNELERRRWFMDSRGYRRCNIAACNCPYWHGGNSEERLMEIAAIVPHNGALLRDAIAKTVEFAELVARLSTSDEHTPSDPDDARVTLDGLIAKARAMTEPANG